jgi:carboxyl-terminal processing protease
MNNQQQKKIVWIFIALLILIIVFFSGKTFGEHGSRVKYTNDISKGGASVTADQMEPFWRVWNVLSEKYVAATTTDNQKRVWGAIQGLAASQNDPYTVFFPPEENKTFRDDIAGNFEGVGMEIGIKDGVLTVVSPLKNSPAERAGVKTGDKIVKIDGVTTNDLPVDKAVKKIRGARGTTVKIVFVREGSSEPLEKSIVRDVIDIPTLETSTKSDVFVIKLFSFTAQSSDLFRNAIREFLQSGKNKLIIDLRGNPGGYLEAAWDMSSWFLPIGSTIVTEDFGGKGENKVYRSKGYDILNKFFGKNNYKVAILVNNGSASASEIMAGALKENGVAKLVGVKTFGKGSVQELVPITIDTSLKVTIARWLTPNGHNLSHDGLDPDFEVKMTQKDLDSMKDPQLDKAVEILSK